MSETKCGCGHEKKWHGPRTGASFVQAGIDWWCICEKFEPAEPVIEVAPGEYERCDRTNPSQGACSRCAEPQAGAQVPSLMKLVGDYRAVVAKHPGGFPEGRLAEIDAALGAQVPSQSAYMKRKSMTMQDEMNEAESEINTLQQKLDHITAYATESAKTTITRESIAATKGEESLRLLAYSQHDEMQGLRRLILSESGDAK